MANRTKVSRIASLVEVHVCPDKVHSTHPVGKRFLRLPTPVLLGVVLPRPQRMGNRSLVIVSLP